MGARLMRKILFALLAFVFATAAQAQFADQRQYAAFTGGSANAQTVAIPNYALNPGVAVRFVPSFTNNSATTLNVNGTGDVPLEKQTASGLAVLSGGEVVAGQMVEVVFDGAQFELLTTPSSPPIWVGTSVGSANAQTVTASAPNAGQQLTFSAGFTNTGALTLNGVAVVKDLTGGPTALTGGEVVTANVVTVVYGASSYHLLNPSALKSTFVALASASTTDLGATNSPNVAVSGVTTVVSFGSSANVNAPLYRVTFSGALLLTNSSSLLLPGAANITTAAGDSLVAQYLGSGNWRVLAYSVAVLPPSPRAPQVTVYTSGSGTYTTPANALYITVAGVGAGGGGGGGGTTTTGGAGGAGGNTTFGASLTAHGAPATSTSGTGAPATPATATGGDNNISGGLGWSVAYVNGSNAFPEGPGGANSIFGHGGVGATFRDNGVNKNAATPGTGYGSGGGGGTASAVGPNGTGWGGNGGAYFYKLIASPAATYAYAIGSGGTAGTAGTSGTAGAAGAAGELVVTAYFQ